MSRVKGRDTSPELKVRKLLHRLGYRFRLHRRDLPGNPDIVLPRYHTVIFVHGCFWHGHAGCKRSALPETNREFWETKITGNVRRDQATIGTLVGRGWRVLTIWQCGMKDTQALLEWLTLLLPRDTGENAVVAGALEWPSHQA
jgi:DNA mismatch endonuclease (patch repair protein)